MRDKAIWVIIAIVTLLIIALVVIAIIFIVRDAGKNNKNCKNGNVNYLMIENSSCCDSDCPASLNYACVAPPVYVPNQCGNSATSQCPPSPLCFSKLQTLAASGVSGNNSNFGESLAINSSWLFIGQTTGTNSNVFIFAFDTATGQYTYNSTLTLAGTTPLISLSDTYMSVSTNSSGVGALHEYSYDGTSWNLLSTTSFTNPIVSISQYKSSVAIVSNFVAYVYSGGILNAEFNSLNAVSIAMDGDINKDYLIIGSLGAAYAFSKLIASTSWGEIRRSYVGDNIQFGANVSIDAPKFAISDYQNSQLLVYNVCQIDSPAAIINALGDPTTTIFTPGVLVTGYSSLTLYSSQNSMFDPPCFFPGYEWDYDGGGPIGSAVGGINAAVKYNSAVLGIAIDIFVKSTP